MKSFYDRNEKYTEEATRISGEATELLRIYFNWAKQNGYSVRDLSHVLYGVVLDLELETLL